VKLKRFREVNIKMFGDEGGWAIWLLLVLSVFCDY